MHRCHYCSTYVNFKLNANTFNAYNFSLYTEILNLGIKV